MSRQNVEVQIVLHYKDQPSERIDGVNHPTRERIMRDLYEMLRDGECPYYKEIRRPISEEK